MDTAPIVYMLEDHPDLAPRYAAFFERARASYYELTKPPVWRVVDVTAAIAERAARIRSRSRLRLPDAIQMATALETSSVALVTRDRDFSGLAALGEGVAVYG